MAPKEGEKKKTRGPTKNKVVATEGCTKKKVSFNTRGHWIKKKSVKFASFLGSLVREVVPITLPSWLKLPKQSKDDLWVFIQQQYIVDDCHQKFIIQKMGSYWRQYKSSLSKKIKEVVDKGVDVKKEIKGLKPSNLNDEDWEAFVKKRTSFGFKAISQKFSEMRKLQTIQHTMGRKGYARLEDEMVEANKTDSTITRVDVWERGHLKKNGQPVNEIVGGKLEQLKKCSQMSSNSVPSIMEDDITQVLGPEKRGHIRGLGFGCTPSKVDLQLKTNSVVKDLQEDVRSLKASQLELKNMIFHNMKMGMRPNQDQANDREEIVHDPVSSSQDSQRGNTDFISTGNDVTNENCKLLSWMGTGEVVAEGQISSTNPHDLVHHMVLGPDFWRVWVNRVLVDRVQLLRPTSDMSFLDDALGSTVAWPSKYIALS